MIQGEVGSYFLFKNGECFGFVTIVALLYCRGLRGGGRWLGMEIFIDDWMLLL